MDNNEYFVNRVIQGGIYFFETDPCVKKRPYLIISKDNGYGLDVLAFLITEQFISSKVNLPILLDGKISFIRVSGAREINKSKINHKDFSGLLRPDVFSIATRMYMNRFANVKEDQLEEDINRYLDDLSALHVPYYLNNSKIFKKEDYLNDVPIKMKEPKKINVKKEAIYNGITNGNHNVKIDKRSDDVIINEIIKSDYWTMNRLREFQSKMYKKSNKDLTSIFKTDINTVKCLRDNISFIITQKRNFRHIK